MKFDEFLQNSHVISDNDTYGGNIAPYSTRGVFP